MNVKQLTILFWNINKQPLANQIANIVKKHDVDIVILAECLDEDKEDIHNQLDRKTFYFSANENCSKIKVFSKIGPKYFRTILDHKRMTIKELKIDQHKIFISALHLISKVNSKSSYQTVESIDYIQSINKIEKDNNNYKTIVVGDFNMNPFEDGIANYTL